MSMENTLWMGDIEPWMTRELILTSFFEYGLKPSSIKMLKDHKNNASRNYCFINFDTMFEANKALIELNGKKIPNTNITFRLNWANKHCELNQNLYIGNLSNDIDDITLFEIFKNKYPSVHHVSIMTDKGESKGYGFIQFTDKCDYNKCLKEMDGYIFIKRPIDRRLLRNVLRAGQILLRQRRLRRSCYVVLQRLKRDRGDTHYPGLGRMAQKRI